MLIEISNGLRGDETGELELTFKSKWNACEVFGDVFGALFSRRRDTSFGMFGFSEDKRGRVLLRGVPTRLALVPLASVCTALASTTVIPPESRCVLLELLLLLRFSKSTNELCFLSTDVAVGADDTDGVGAPADVGAGAEESVGNDDIEASANTFSETMSLSLSGGSERRLPLPPPPPMLRRERLRLDGGVVGRDILIGRSGDFLDGRCSYS